MNSKTAKERGILRALNRFASSVGCFATSIIAMRSTSDRDRGYRPWATHCPPKPTCHIDALPIVPHNSFATNAKSCFRETSCKTATSGDIGDFAKFALLRALMPGETLGVAWYLYPDEPRNSDGGQTGYLDQPEKWRDFDLLLFDGLGKIVSLGNRSVAAIEDSALLAQPSSRTHR